MRCHTPIQNNCNFLLTGVGHLLLWGVGHPTDADFMKTITITLDDVIADRLRERAENQGGRSISSLIREACAEKLDRDAATETQMEGVQS